MRRAAVRKPGGLSTRTVALLALGLGGANALGAGAHVHGQGELDVAVENGTVDLFLRAPLGDVAGEEGSDAAALETRFGSAATFTFAGAACTLAMHSAEVAALSDSDAADEFSDHEDEHDHEDDDHHDGDHGHGDDHDEEHDDHEEHGDHEGHEEEDHSGHSDALLSWRYDCGGNPARLDASALFELVALEKILVQSLGESGVSSVTLSPEEAELTLR